jgi:hypothetical protein
MGSGANEQAKTLILIELGDVWVRNEGEFYSFALNKLITSSDVITPVSFP